MSGVHARFDDLAAGTALVFAEAPSAVLIARRVDEVRDVLAAVDSATNAGRWAWGFVAYEAAPGLDPDLRVRTPAAVHPPLAWFAVCDAPDEAAAIERPTGERRYWTAPWTLDTTPDQHAAAISRIHADIAAGTYYQANLTARLSGRVLGDLSQYYADLVHAQGGAYNAYLNTAEDVIVSASPELFFEWSGDVLRSRPMKGTAARSADPGEDAATRDRLRRSAKDIAENIMIVDLLRNDLGRIARTGTVRVPRLLDVERYESVWQLTSEITATVEPGLTLVDAFTALFPCGSVTGAPKGSAMSAIARLETAPRGVYCGAIGWVAPPANATRARFSVAIRTVRVDERSGAASYGSGGGITIGSEPAAEFRELLDKTAVLARAEPAASAEPLMLLETFGYEPERGFRNLDRHLARLARSAQAFGFRYTEDTIRSALNSAVAADDSAGALRVALRLAGDGRPTVGIASLGEPLAAPVRLAVDDEPVEPDLLWLRHKTSRRSIYEQARKRHPTVDDVVLVNTRGELTETTIANLAARLDGRWYTPPLTSGCLPGIGREIAVEQGIVHERVLRAEDLAVAEKLAVISSLRGWRSARFE